MKFSEADGSNGLFISAYEPGLIRVGSTTYRSSVIVAPDRVLDDWRPVSVAGIDQGDLAPILSLEPEIVILGTGAIQSFPDPGVYAPTANAGVGLEVMDTGAACRTYNILVSEGRRVVAALIMI
jgi:uncharacterized protein